MRQFDKAHCRPVVLASHVAMPGNVEERSKLHVGNFTAEILKANTAEDGWYVVVQPRNSRDIVAIDRFETYEKARESATRALEQMNAARGAQGE